jgi:glycosyltransferase involved in cell wall biosynthesis
MSDVEVRGEVQVDVQNNVHVLIDVAGPWSDLGGTEKAAVFTVLRAAELAGATRLSVLQRQVPPFSEPGSGGNAGNNGNVRATPPRVGTAVVELAGLVALPVRLLTAPLRDRANPARDVQRLGALAAELGVNLLVTWDLPAPALEALVGGAHVLLLAESAAEVAVEVEAEPGGVTIASWPRIQDLVATHVLLERALGARVGRAGLSRRSWLSSPARQARIQGARLAALCEPALQRTPDALTAEPLDLTGVDRRNALVFLLGPRALYRRHLVSTREIVCGPDMETTFTNGRLATLNVPVGRHDLRKIVEWLPADQKPELVVVKADASWRNLPTHLDGLACPKVLLVGDTHHMQAPLRRVLSYAASEPFDFVVIDHTRHHGHYFVEAGFDKVAWLPAFDVSPHLVPEGRDAANEPSSHCDPCVVFVGQVGAQHPYRTHVLETLGKAGVPLRVLRATPADAARLYAGSRVSLNASLNGDLNLRVFEVLAAGGCLLTDRLSPEAGLDELLRDGEHAAVYQSDAELLARARSLLEDPAEARRLARAGHALYRREHTPGARIAALTRWIDGGSLEARWNLATDRRARMVRSANLGDLQGRLAAYETVQERHRLRAATGERLGLVAWPEVDARLLVDLIDLPRLDLSILAELAEKGEARELDPIARRLLVESGAWERLRFISADALAAAPAAATDARPRVDALLVSPAAFMRMEPKELARLARGRDLIVATRGDGEIQLVLSRQAAFAVEGYLTTPGTGAPVFEQKNPVVLGEIAASEGRLEDALAYLQSALAADPEYVDALNNLGVLAQHTGDIDTACSFLERAIRLDRGNLAALTNLAGLRRDANRLEDAERLLVAATAAAPLDGQGQGQGDVWQQLAQLRHERGDNLGARDALVHLAALDPNRPGMREAMETLRAASVVPAGGAAEATAMATGRLEAGATPARPALRILVLNNLYPPQELGGYGRLMQDFASYLEAAGHTVHVLTSDTAYLGLIREPEASVTRTLQLYGSWKNGRIEELPRDAAVACARQNHATLGAMIESFQPDVAFVGNIDFVAPDIFAPLLARGLPVVHYLANGNPGYAPQDTPTSPLYRPVACSRWLADKLRTELPLHEVGVIYPGARVDDYRMPLPPARRRLHIAYASLVMPYKGAHVLLGALEALAARRIDFTCTIAGHSTDPAFLERLRARAQVGALRGRVQFPGFLERGRLRALFAKSNVLAFPSVFEEPFGISQVEAMAAGLTVVTSGTGGAREIVEHEISGLCFQSEDSAALADALAGLPADPARWQRLAEAGEARAFARFDMRRLAEELEAELHALAARTAKPGRHPRKSLRVAVPATPSRA